jgi:hypothetical protein
MVGLTGYAQIIDLKGQVDAMSVSIPDKQPRRTDRLVWQKSLYGSPERRTAQPHAA